MQVNLPKTRAEYFVSKTNELASRARSLDNLRDEDGDLVDLNPNEGVVDVAHFGPNDLRHGHFEFDGDRLISAKIFQPGSHASSRGLSITSSPEGIKYEETTSDEVTSVLVSSEDGSVLSVEKQELSRPQGVVAMASLIADQMQELQGTDAVDGSQGELSSPLGYLYGIPTGFAEFDQDDNLAKASFRTEQGLVSTSYSVKPDDQGHTVFELNELRKYDSVMTRAVVEQSSGIIRDGMTRGGGIG